VTSPITESTDRHWKGLYTVGGTATLLAMAFFLFDVIGWIILKPYPASGAAWLDLLRNNRLAGILLLSFPTFFGAILYLVTYLCLGNILRRVNAVVALLATLLAVLGSAILLLSHSAIPVLVLGAQYDAAAGETQRAALLSALDARLLSGAAGISLSGFFSEGALLVFSILMLRSGVFAKWIAVLGLLGHGLDFLRIVLNFASVPDSATAILLMIGGLPQLVWLIAVGIRLIQLGMKKEIA
jgi:hypothetical protein